MKLKDINTPADFQLYISSKNMHKYHSIDDIEQHIGMIDVKEPYYVVVYWKEGPVNRIRARVRASILADCYFNAADMYIDETSSTMAYLYPYEPTLCEAPWLSQDPFITVSASQIYTNLEDATRFKTLMEQFGTTAALELRNNIIAIRHFNKRMIAL